MRCSELGSVLIVLTPARAPDTKPIWVPIRKPPPARANEAHGENRRRTPEREVITMVAVPALIFHVHLPKNAPTAAPTNPPKVAASNYVDK
jgi:hypothetical protein